MKEHIIERARRAALFITANRATVRETSKVFGVSKSTVHKDVTERLKTIDRELYAKVKSVLDFNLSERHLRGGVATREKYLKEKSDKGHSAQRLYKPLG